MKTILLTIILCILHVQVSNAQWVQVLNGIGSVNSLAVNVNTIFAGTSTNSGGVHKSTNYGLTWTQTSLNSQDFRSLAVNGNNIYAGSYSGNGVYKSTDNGTSWTQTSLNNQIIRTLAVSGNNVYAGSFNGNGLYKSTDNGTSWTQTSFNNQNVRSMAVNGNNIYVGSGNTPGTGVYLSTDNGTSWIQTPLNNLPVLSLAVNGSNVFAGPFGISPSGIYKSTNNGTSWSQTSLNNVDVYSLAVNGNNVFAGTIDYGVYVSTDNGTSWTQRIEGLSTSNTIVFDLCLLSNYIFAGIGYGGNMGVYRRSLGEVTSIQTVSNELPNKFSLLQNYPNPFNPNTQIRFIIPNPSFVKLVVYDIMGREVTSLVNEQLNTGVYEIDWNASNYPSGVYYYKLIAGDYTETKKMVLVK
jgi:Secretion system C-terminal sorting domain